MLEVDKFVSKVVLKGTMLGPFPSPIFLDWSQISPLMTLPKKDSTSHWMIIDLSFPNGRSVNSRVTKNISQGPDFSYTLPLVHDLAHIVLESGPGTHM